jgi:hypothetical protein
MVIELRPVPGIAAGALGDVLRLAPEESRQSA